MTKRRRLMLVAVVAAVGVMALPPVVRWMFTPAPGVTVENFKRLHVGMPLDEIEAILGRPPDSTFEMNASYHEYTWHGEDDMEILIRRGAREIEDIRDGFLTRDLVLQMEMAKRPETWIEKIRRWVGR